MGEEMDDMPRLSGSGDHSDSDEETVKGAHDEDHITEFLEEEMQSPSTPVAQGNSVIANRYRELLQDGADTASEDGSTTDAIPRRAGSPVDSMLSVPDDSPSVQVDSPFPCIKVSMPSNTLRAPCYPPPVAVFSPR